MADWEKFMGRPRLGRCSHRSTVSTVTAGLERSVCEDCGQVSVRFVTETVKLYPDFNDLSVAAGRDRPRGVNDGAGGTPPTCGSCDARAEFMIPRGLACAEHAWAAASRQDALGYELWIPIRIDQNTKAGG